MKSRIIKITALFAAIIMSACVFAACGGGNKITKGNLEKINNTMDLAAVEAIIGKATNDLRGEGNLAGRVVWDATIDGKKTYQRIDVFMDFGENGKVVSFTARCETTPNEGGQSVIDWDVRYPAP